MPYNVDAYLACLPPHLQERAQTPPESTWWPWNGHSVHIARARRPDAGARLLILHGAGGHSGALWPAAALAADLGYDVLAPDLPGYGRTKVPDPGAVRYPDWLDCVCALIRAEQQADPRPLVLLGASMGGMLAYSACARLEQEDGGSPVARLMATCLLDPADPEVWSALSPWLGRWSLPLMDALAPLLDRRRLPIRWLTPMNRIANQPALSKLCRTDPRGGGGSVALGFLRSYLNAPPERAPERFTTVPVLLTHPAADRWTAPALSLRFLERIAAPTRHIPLENAGHFPVEEPGIEQLRDVLRDVLTELTAKS